MKRLFLAIAIIAMSVCTMQAQSQVKYHGEVDLGYSFGVGTFAADRINIQTIQGVQLGKHFSTGLGLGFDYYTNIDGYGELAMPIYLNLKGYLPTSEKTSVYASFDIGVGVGLTEGVKGLSGATYTPAIGVKVNKFKVQLGYNVQRLSESGIGINLGALQLKLGLMF